VIEITNDVGSWDLQFFAPRGFLSNPSQAVALAQSLARLRDRTQHCGDQVGTIHGNVCSKIFMHEVDEVINFVSNEKLKFLRFVDV
jgi:hypothetical protein